MRYIPETAGDYLRNVDLLIVLGNTPGMLTTQRRFAAALPRLVEILETGDNGTSTLYPIDSLHIGVVTSDMGDGSGDSCTVRGDDGVLLGESCEGMFFANGDDGSELTCRVDVGDEGCRFAQPLDAAFKAITPSTSRLTFRGGVGHADGVNSGFLRYDAALVMVLVTDHDDCSVLDPELFALDTARYPGPMGLRCSNYPDALALLERYMQFGDAWPEQRAYAAFAGIPPELEGSSHAELLAAEPMRQRPDDADPTRLRYSCTGEDVAAFPPRRIVSVASELNAAGVPTLTRSICRDDFTEPMRDLAELVSDTMVDPSCLRSPLARDSTGRIDCELVEVHPDTVRCEDLEAREPAESDPGFTVCRLRQVAPEDVSAVGWYYDDFSEITSRRCPMGQRFAFHGIDPRGRFVLHCSPHLHFAIGRACVSDEDCNYYGVELYCAEEDATCQAR